MGKVHNITINPDIQLDERFTKNMPEDIKQNILITLTIGMKRYECDWRDLTWKVRFNKERMPIISVKRKVIPRPTILERIKKIYYNLFPRGKHDIIRQTI